MAINPHLRRTFVKVSTTTLAILVSLLSVALSSYAQDSKQEEQKKKEEQKKQESSIRAEEKAAKKQAKEERRYQKIKTFALKEYQTDFEFKDSVDDRYRIVRQEHTRTAYNINTRPSNLKLVSRDGEKLRFDNTLYDNPLAQDYVNRVGQSLVPSNSTKLYAFKVLQDPVPQARALATGTIYISTGYLSIIDNEAQLAYILSHEIAHVEKDHWLDDILVELGTVPYLKKNPSWSMIGRQLLTNMTVEQIVAFDNLRKTQSTDETFQWEPIQEDEADIESLKYMFARNYDVREIPKLYERMLSLTSDPRTQTGFIADPERIKDRLQIFNASSQQYIKANTLVGATDLSQKNASDVPVTGMRGVARMLNETLAPEIQKRLNDGELIASTEEFQSVMALVKRDNGIRAFQFDMFELARKNLENSISIRSNDPSAYYYYGKVLKQTARNATEISKALQNLTKAIELDQRQTIAEPYLFRAMLRLAERNPAEAQLITQDLRTYVTIYQRENAGSLPPNMEFIYDFMQDFGILNYRVSPSINVADAAPPANVPRSVVEGPTPVTAPPTTVTNTPGTAAPPVTPKQRGGTKKP